MVQNVVVSFNCILKQLCTLTNKQRFLDCIRTEGAFIYMS